MADKENDIEIDKKFAQYLDKIYKDLGLTIKRLTYEEFPALQQQGVDIIQRRKNGNFFRDVNIDEKARQRSANSMTEDTTFAFEITAFSVLNGNRIPNRKPYHGWFIDKNQSSEEYHLIINIKTKEDKYTSCDIYKINKLNIKNALKKLGLTDANLLCKTEALRYDIEVNKNIAYPRNKGNTGYIFNCPELVHIEQRCECGKLMIIQNGLYGRYLRCLDHDCNRTRSFFTSHGFMFYTDKKYDGSNVPELPINLVLTLNFLIDCCDAEKIF